MLQPPSAEPGLARRVGPGLLTIYGVGVMVGAGIYVLVGHVAGSAGVWAPLAFLIAGLVALPSALTFAEMSTRMPEAAGEVAYVERGFGWSLAIATGLAVVVTGTVSAAAVLRGGVGYLTSVVPIDPTLAILGLGLVLTVVAILGVVESLVVIALLTLAEVSGLIAVIWAGFAAEPAAQWGAGGAIPWAGVLGAVTLCIFAFIGFEDMVNMAEEVHRPSRTMPIAIIGALSLTALLYAGVSFAAVRSTSVEALATSEQPLALVWETATGRPAVFLTAIAVAAALNGVLAQIVMAARVLLGLGRRAAALAVFAHAHPRFHTPARATALVGIAVTLAAYGLAVATLAEAAASVLLVIFCLVNGAAIRIKARAPEAPFTVPAIVPWAGLLFSLAALAAALTGVA